MIALAAIILSVSVQVGMWRGLEALAQCCPLPAVVSIVALTEDILVPDAPPETDNAPVITEIGDLVCCQDEPPSANGMAPIGLYDEAVAKDRNVQFVVGNRWRPPAGDEAEPNCELLNYCGRAPEVSELEGKKAFVTLINIGTDRVFKIKTVLQKDEWPLDFGEGTLGNADGSASGAPQSHSRYEKGQCEGRSADSGKRFDCIMVGICPCPQCEEDGRLIVFGSLAVLALMIGGAVLGYRTGGRRR